jgi:tetratricopeptide (TPR) repeat protein
MADIVCDAAIADGDWELAQDAAARLSRLATELHDPRLAALARYQEARIAVHDRLPDEDREVFLLRIGAEDEDAAARSRAHLHLGSSAQEAGDLGRARHHYEQSILAAQADGDLGVEGVGWVHLSQVRYLQGARDEARERIEDAIRLLRHVEDEESLQAALEVRAAMGATD